MERLTISLSALLSAVTLSSATGQQEPGKDITAVPARGLTSPLFSDGRLMEWPEEFKDSENGGHRHLSHLFGLYPGSQITPRATPEWAAAARRSLETRLANGASGCEWTSAWTINLFARLLDGEKAHEYILWHLKRMIAPNLFDLCGGPFQIDGNFGYTAGVCEMLLQSQERAEDGGQKSEVGHVGGVARQL